MAYDGAQYSSRVDGLTQRSLYTKVVDQVLNAPAYASRLIGSAMPFSGKTMDFTLDVVAAGQGQWITGLETLNSSAESTTVTTSYARAFFTIPVVSIMTESFANGGSLGIINLDTFKYEKAAQQALQTIGTAVYGFGQAGQIGGLEGIVDAGTNAASIGGVSRSTYSVLNATVTAASSSKLTLAQMDTLHDAVSAAGINKETPNVGLTTKGIFSLYTQLLAPTIRASYDQVGYDKVGMKSKYGERNTAELRGSSGMTAVSYRDFHIMKDDLETTAGLTNLYFLNEEYVNFYGDNMIPEEYKDVLEHVDFGSMSATEGTGASSLEMPSEYHGWFYQKPMTIPEQAGRISRFYVVGNTIGKSFRRQGKLTTITGI